MLRGSNTSSKGVWMYREWWWFHQNSCSTSKILWSNLTNPPGIAGFCHVFEVGLGESFLVSFMIHFWLLRLLGGSKFWGCCFSLNHHDRFPSDGSHHDKVQFFSPIFSPEFGKDEPNWWKTRWWFQICSLFTPAWGNDPNWLVFFKWVETTR